DVCLPALAGPAARATRIAARDSVYAAARRTLVDSIGPTLGRNGVRWAERVVLNNAALLAHRAYLSGLDGFDAELTAQRGALRPAVDALIARHRAAR
ncbi:MAG: hypothetical protein K2X99_11460, partial [Gemmatimonadaceae bacterium]|nr:hypothetical protein [Gemmatimonadaceae bacterium]